MARTTVCRAALMAAALIVLAVLQVSGCRSKRKKYFFPPVTEYQFTDIAPPGGYVSSFAFHPIDPNVVYAGMDDSGGLYVSRDRGATWKMVSLGRQNWSTWEVVINPDDPNVITVSDGYGHGILRSEDGGATWAERNNGLPNQDLHRLIKAMALDPQNSSVLYIGTADGVYKSTDGAQSWQRKSQGLPAGKQVFRLAIDPADTSRVFAGLDGGEIYVSTDAAQNWNCAFDLFPAEDFGEFWDLVVAPSDPNRIIAGAGYRVVLSADGGGNWSDIASAELSGLGGAPIGVTAAFDPSNADVIYIGTFIIYGQYIIGNNMRLRSDDGGNSFTDITAGLEHEGVFRIRVSPHDSQMVLAGLGGDAIERSFDRGGTWQSHTGRPSVPTGPGDFAVAPSNSSRIYLACSPPIFRSDDGGKNWQRTMVPEYLFWKIAVHPQDPDFVLLAPLFIVTPGLYRSTDGAGNWEYLNSINNMSVMCILFSSTNSDTVYVGTYSPGGGEFGVYRSDDRGDSFVRLTPTSWFDTLAASVVLEHPGGNGALLVATVNGIYTSNANQSVFTQFALAGKNLMSLDVLEDGLWVAGGENAAYVSRDAGLTWQTHLHPGSQVTAVLIDPDRPGRILLGVSAEDFAFTAESQPGLYVSNDSGETFREISAKLHPCDHIYRLAKDYSLPNTYLFSVYSAAGGLYRVRIP